MVKDFAQRAFVMALGQVAYSAWKRGAKGK